MFTYLFKNITYENIESFENNLLLIIEKYIYDYSKDKEYIVEFFQINNDLLNLRYVKDQNNLCIFPLGTFAIFLSTDSPIIFSTNITLDIYKYKKFEDKNNFHYFFPKKNKIIFLEANKYYGFINSTSKNSNNVIFINIWDKHIQNEITSHYYPENNQIQKLIHSNIYTEDKIEKHYDNTIINRDFLINIFYEKKTELLKNILLQINVDDNHDLNVFYSKTPLKNVNYYDVLCEKYGEIIKSLYDLEINKINNFESSVICSILTTEIKNWFILEVNKKNMWSNELKFDLDNQTNYLFLSFIFSIIKPIMINITNLYNLQNININFKYYYIKKLTKNYIYDENNNFITFVLLLNGEVKITDNNNNEELYLNNKNDIGIFLFNNFSIKNITDNDILITLFKLSYTL